MSRNASLNAACGHLHHNGALSALRNGAGYSSANAFAEAVKIPNATYQRYESNSLKIPLRAAWVLADALGVTIDAVAGRRSAVTKEDYELISSYNALSKESKSQLRAYIQYLSFCDHQIQRQAR